jgi:purine-nucleoside phosphorylase
MHIFRTKPTFFVFSYTFEVIQEITNFLLASTKYRPKIGIICGSGLGHLADAIEDFDAFPYEKIPNFPVSTVQGHAGKMIFGRLNGIEVMCMQGRFHHYEGYPLATCSMPVRVMKLCGCTHLIATNAVGGLNENYKVGDIMIVKDHINIMGFVGNSPLHGPNDSRQVVNSCQIISLKHIFQILITFRFGSRFLPMNKAYDAKLIKIAEELARDLGMEQEAHVGVLICLGGPNYETCAELKMWKILGVDSVGMSIVSFKF